MFDRPSLADADLASAIRSGYGVPVVRAGFLGLGHDANAWTFRVDTGGGAPLFVKLRRSIDDARLVACRFLFEAGIEAVVAPLRTRSGGLAIPIGDLRAVAYPFVEARPAVEVGLTDDQWRAYGALVGRLHRTRLPLEISAGLPHEAFESTALASLERVDRAIDRLTTDGQPDLDATRASLAALWRARRSTIGEIADRTRELSTRLSARRAADGSAGVVPCHGDVHTHNVLVDTDGALRIVDWDELMMAPPERDLMFVVGSPIGLARGRPELASFFDGYGPVEIDPERLAYYHADWAVQDLVGYAEEALAEVASPTSRAAALAIFRGLFQPGDEVEVALDPPSGIDLER